MSYLDEAGKRSISLVKNIREDKNIPEKSKELVKKYISFMEARGLTERTVNKNLYCLAVYLKAIGNHDLLKAKRDDIEAAMGVIEKSNYSARTKQHIKITLKSMYKHFLGEDLYYPKQVAWIKSGMGKTKRLLPDDILSEEDVLKLLDATQNVRDSAIIALLFDAGLRIGELMEMRMKDVDLNGDPCHVTVDGKTGMRKIPITFSVHYLAQYLNTNKEMKPNDHLWKVQGSWLSTNRSVDYSALRVMLKRTAKRAGINKRIYPHLFRHSRASYYANKLTEQQLKVFFGWTGDSRMAATYVHLSGRDIDNAILEANGKKPAEVAASKLTEKVCPRCKAVNGISFLHCQRCGADLDVAMMIKSDQVAQELKESMLESVKDPGYIKEQQEHIAKNQNKKKSSA